MSAAQNVSALCRELDSAVVLYSSHLQDAAEAEAEHKKHRAKRVLKARSDGEKSITAAETVAEADDFIADLYLKRLTTAAVAESTKQRIASLKERIQSGRSLMADQREQDRQHAMSGGQYA